jgi:hypothetical protein
MLPDTLIYGRDPISGKVLFTLNMYFDSNFLEPIGVNGVGAISENAVLQWRVKNKDTLEVRTDQQFVPGGGHVLFNARFRVKLPKEATASMIGIPSLRLFTDCCFTQSDSLPNAILIDGLCEKIVRRRAEFTLEPNSPNPVRGETEFHFTVLENEHFSSAPATLTLYRADGTEAGQIYNAAVSAGEYVVPYVTSSLPAGTYYYVLTMNGRSQTRSMIVVK